MLSKEDKKHLRKCKRMIAWYNIQIAVLFIYSCIYLFAYPFTFGLVLGDKHIIFNIISVICFWVQFYLVSRKDHPLNVKMDGLGDLKDNMQCYIRNYEFNLSLSQNQYK